MHEDDLRWVANLSLGIAFFVAFAGVIFAQFMGAGDRCYVMVMSVLIGAAFAAAGGWFHYVIWNKIQRTTIKRQGGG